MLLARVLTSLVVVVVVDDGIAAAVVDDCCCCCSLRIKFDCMFRPRNERVSVFVVDAFPHGYF